MNVIYSYLIKPEQPPKALGNEKKGKNFFFSKFVKDNQQPSQQPKSTPYKKLWALPPLLIGAGLLLRLYTTWSKIEKAQPSLDEKPLSISCYDSNPCYGSVSCSALPIYIALFSLAIFLRATACRPWYQHVKTKQLGYINDEYVSRLGKYEGNQDKDEYYNFQRNSYKFVYGCMDSATLEDIPMKLESQGEKTVYTKLEKEDEC